MKLEAGGGLALDAPAGRPWTIAWGSDDWFGPLDVWAGGKPLPPRAARALAPTGGRPLQVRYEGGLFHIPVSLEDRGWVRIQIDVDSPPYGR
jgi:hypothetical protein